MIAKKTLQRYRRHAKIRTHLLGPAERPRLVVFRSNKAIYGQIVNDTARTVLASSSSLKIRKGNKTEIAKAVGLDLARKALQYKITTCVFDRAGYKYHGRVKALAEGAREGGLKF